VALAWNAAERIASVGWNFAFYLCGLAQYFRRMRRKLLKDVTRIVLKLGTGVLTDSRKQPDLAQMEQLVGQIADQRSKGKEVVLVTSGAVGAGMGVLGYTRRPVDAAELQACAAVGQSRLMANYQKLFDGHGLPVAQVLLTHDDLEHHERHLNARNALVTLSLAVASFPSSMRTTWSPSPNSNSATMTNFQPSSRLCCRPICSSS